MGEISAVWQGLDWFVLVGMLLSVIPILICITIHELAHGLAAYALGDDTAKRMGRLTLNPLRHIDPIGFIMLLFVRFGWAKPVPVNMLNFKRPKFGMAITALAGPLSNFLLAALILLFQEPLGLPLNPFYLQTAGPAIYLAWILETTAVISIFLGLFNLLPIPPLDGSKILFSVLRDTRYHWLMRYEHYGMFLLFGLIFFGGFIIPGGFMGHLWAVMDRVYQWIADITAGPSQFLFS